ncbi:hypothetical protein GQ457_18G011370 [Hibiscus cannabinus]
MSFFKRYWELIKDEFMKFCRDFYHNQHWEASLNHSFITLIPKKSNPESLDEYRPISQQILDCSLIANEVIDSVYKSGASGVAFKIDFKKAYDSVDWNFLLKIMEEMSFGDSFLSQRGFDKDARYPLLLFNLVGEALSLMLNKAMAVGLFFGIQIGNNSNSVIISHLQFADDLMVFCEASGLQVLAVKRVLRVFELASGLGLNLKKSRVFGLNVDQASLQSWANAIGCSMGSLSTEYLGLPLGVRHNSIKLWEPILKKLSTKLASWKSQLLSFGGRISLVKSVLSSLPMFFMSLFRMPVAVSKRITCMVSNFLWGGTMDKKRIHWVNWSLLCQSVENGRLGLMDFDLQNRCLLGKWVWRFSAENDILWRKVIQSKHKRGDLALFPPPLSRQSYWVWKGIMKSSFADDTFGNIFQNNLSLCVGDGRFIHFWLDTWLCEQPLSTKFSRIFALAINKVGVIVEFRVRRLNNWSWKIYLRRCLFDWEVPSWNELLTLLAKFHSSRLGRGWLQWIGLSDWLYSIKTMKAQLSLVPTSVVNWKKVVWIGLAPPKVEAFMWLILHERVPVKVELLKRGRVLETLDLTRELLGCFLGFASKSIKVSYRLPLSLFQVFKRYNVAVDSVWCRMVDMVAKE